MVKHLTTLEREASLRSGQACGAEADNIGSIPVTLDFANILGLNVLLLPVGRGDDGAHSTNEKLDTSNYINVSVEKYRSGQS